MSQTYTVVDNRPSGERVLATGLTWPEVAAYLPPAGVWSLTARAEVAAEVATGELAPAERHGLVRPVIMAP